MVSILPSNTALPSMISSSTPTYTKTPVGIQATGHPTSALNETSNGLFSVTPSRYNQFQGNLFILGRSTFLINNQPISHLKIETAVDNHEGFLIFGQRKRKYRHIVLGSTESKGLYTSLKEPSLFRDQEPRSSTIIGDIDANGAEDIVMGYPHLSMVQIHLGIAPTSARVSRFQDLPLSLMIVGSTGDGFGWASCKIGDYNKDGYDDFLISAKNVGIVYFFYGGSLLLKTKGSLSLSDHLTRNSGWKIIGAEDTVNTGLAISSAGDFNGDGFVDLLISALSSSSEGIIYLLFGDPLNRDDVLLTHFNSSMGFIFQAPPRSFSGLSLANIGDWNQDAFDDIAIGSLPYENGRYSTQMTMIIFGRRENFTSSNCPTLLMDIIEGEEGFHIHGGGFYVMNIGDWTNDNIPELLIVNYPSWYYQKTGNVFIVVPPTEKNGTTPPTFLPSLAPTFLPSDQPASSPSFPIYFPSNQPSINFSGNDDDNTASPVIGPPTSLRPSLSNITNIGIYSLSPSQKIRKSNRPTLKLTPLPTKSPSIIPPHVVSSPPPSTNQPSLLMQNESPTLASSKGLSHRPTTARHTRSSHSPIISPTSYPTFSDDTTKNSHDSFDSFTTITIDSEGEYNTDETNSNLRNVLFLIQTDGIVKITGSFHGKNIFKCFPIQNDEKRLTIITLAHFKVSSDQIDVAEFSQFKTFQDIPYATNPLRYFLANNYELVLPSFMSSSSSSESSENFPPLDASNFRTSSNFRSGAESSTAYSIEDVIMISIPVIIILIAFSVCIFGEKINKEETFQGFLHENQEQDESNKESNKDESQVIDSVDRSNDVNSITDEFFNKDYDDDDDSLGSHWISLLEEEEEEEERLSVDIEGGYYEVSDSTRSDFDFSTENSDD